MNMFRGAYRLSIIVVSCRAKCAAHFAPRASLISATVCGLASHAAIKVMLFKRAKLVCARL